MATILCKLFYRFLCHSTLILLTSCRNSNLLDRNHNAMDKKFAKMRAGLEKKKARAKKNNQIRRLAKKAAMKRRWSDPVAPARRPLGNVDSNRRQSEPPPPLASAAAVKASERKQTQHFTYDSMPKHHRYRRKRGDSGSSSGEPAAAAASTMGHAYVDAAVVSSGIASIYRLSHEDTDAF